MRAGISVKKYAISCTFIALLFIALFLGTFPGHTGGAQGAHSPDGEFVAHASSLRNVNPLKLGSRDTFYELSVTRLPNIPFKRVVIYPSEKNGEHYFRELPQIVSWAADSSEVTFAIPGATVKLDMKDHPFNPQ